MRDARSTDRDRLAMISELAQASGIAGCAAVRRWIWREGHQVDLPSLLMSSRHKTGASDSAQRYEWRNGRTERSWTQSVFAPALDR